jgi:hypothetical protein
VRQLLHEVEPPELFEVLDRAAHDHVLRQLFSLLLQRVHCTLLQTGVWLWQMAALWICAVIAPHLFVNCSPTA